MRPNRNWLTSGPNPLGGFLKLWSQCSARCSSRVLISRRSTRFDDTVLGYPLPLPTLVCHKGAIGLLGNCLRSHLSPDQLCYWELEFKSHVAPLNHSCDRIQGIGVCTAQL
nr:hypothetical protein CFP56_26765 [Quercus suber]